jgi:signal transduction histidine kinase
MLTRLRESVNSSQRFLADASHELRTPLTIIKGELEEIAANPQGIDNTTDRIGSVLEEVDRLKSLVEGLLVLSRLDAGEALREFVPVDLGDLVASTAEQMRLLAEDGGVTLKISTQPAITVQGDRARLKQVVVNLLDNAIKYTQRGGTVSLTAYRSAHRGILEVSDTGPGIPPAALPHVFDRFYRADESRTRHGTSVGLGLSIVKSICIAHAASVDVESTIGSGSCFRVSLPLAELAPQATLPAPSADVGHPPHPTPRPAEETP